MAKTKTETDGLADNISIKNIIRAVHEELIASQKEREANNRSVLFEVESLELEVHFIAGSTSEKGGGLNLKVLDANLNKSYKKEFIQTLRLKLKVSEQALKNKHKGVYACVPKSDDLDGKHPLLNE